MSVAAPLPVPSGDVEGVGGLAARAASSSRRRRVTCDRPAMCVLGLGCATKNDHTPHHPSGVWCLQNIADGLGMYTKGERTCGSYVPSTCRAKRHPGRELAPNANDGGGRHAPTTRVARASAARLAPALSSAAPAERGWSRSIVASTDARWAVRRAVRRAENSRPRRNMRAHREYRCGSYEERAVRHRSWRARPHRGSSSPQS